MKAPKFKVGDRVKILSQANLSWVFTIYGVVYNEDHNDFEYTTNRSWHWFKEEDIYKVEEK